MIGRRAGRIAAVALALGGAPALAQPAQPAPADPIDALLRQKTIEEEPDVAASGSSVVEADPVLPARPQPYVPARPILTEPVFLHEVGKAPDGPPTEADQAYDSRLRSSAAAVRGFQGPMEGAWTLSAGGRAVYALQLVDRGGYVDGAWRDLRRTGALDGSGFIDDVQRAGGDVTIRFAEGIVAVLRAADGRWTGQLIEGGRTEAVMLVRARAVAGPSPLAGEGGGRRLTDEGSRWSIRLRARRRRCHWNHGPSPTRLCWSVMVRG